LFAPELKLSTLAKPIKPGAGSDETDLAIWTEDVRDHVKRKRVLRNNLAAIQAVVCGQCSEAMKAKVKSLDGYEKSAMDDDSEWLIKKSRLSQCSSTLSTTHVSPCWTQQQVS
jgi:hypothetical protein